MECVCDYCDYGFCTFDKTVEEQLEPDATTWECSGDEDAMRECGMIE